MASTTVVISGQSVMIVAGTLQIVCAVGRRSTASFTVYSASLATHLQQYQQVQIYNQASYLIFSGYVINPNEGKPGFQSSLLTTVTCCDQHFLADKRKISAAYQNQTPAQIVYQIATTILAQEGVTIGMIYDPNPALFFSLTTITSTSLFVALSSAAIPNAQFNYCTCAAAMDALTTAANSSGIPYYWQIDQFKVLWFVPYTMIAGPAIDGTQIEQINNPPVVIRANPTYRNVQYVTGGTAQTVLQNEVRMGDGVTQSWTMGYPLASAPVVLFDGASQAVALKGSTGSQFYWAQGDPTIAQDKSQSIPLSTDTLNFAYIGQFPQTAVTTNAAQVAYQAALDGTSGIIEEAENDPTITTLAGGYAEASAILTRYAQQGTQLTCYTMQTGFVQGQSSMVNLPMFGINNAAMLVESVTITDQVDNYNIWYQLSLVIGPYDTTVAAFWGNLIGNNQPMPSLNVGASSSVALLAPFTASITPTATMTPVVTSCPIVGLSTFANTTTIVC